MEIYELINHLKACPETFLQRLNDTQGENLPAEVLIYDTYRSVYGDFNAPDAELSFPDDIRLSDENYAFSCEIACWLISYPFFRNKRELLPGIHRFLFDDLVGLSPHVKYRTWVEDDDRAEEFVRLMLNRCNILPEGETPESASDRLDALDTLKRMSVLKESHKAMERIKEIRRQMAEKKAREAANVYGRE